MNKLSRFAVLATGVLALSACSGTGQDEPAADEEVEDLTIAVVTHGAPDDSFWSVVKAGSDRSGEDLGINVEYNSDPDATAQSELIDQAVADEVDGIVVSMANPDGLRDSLEAAVEAGVPVITINSGVDESAEFGAITHIGQSEDIAGEAAGEQFRTGACRRCRASPPASAPARSHACWATTAPASRRSSRSSPAPTSTPVASC
jgi:simple sugar transport system substrate-binding protein